MSASFNAAEVFELAWKVERYGEQFYRSAAQAVDDDGARKLLQDLADYEVQHQETFREMKEAFVARADDADLSDLDDTATQYLHAMANGAVFDVDGDPLKRAHSLASVEEILRLALQMENLSISFYTGIQRAMPADWGPERVEAIIREEMSHVVYISNELAKRHGV